MGEWAFPLIALEGDRIAIAGGGEILVFEASGKAIGRFLPSNRGEFPGVPSLASGGRELQVSDWNKALHRFKPP